MLTLVPERGWGVAERFVNLQTDLFGKSWPAQGLIAPRDTFASHGSRTDRAAAQPDAQPARSRQIRALSERGAVSRCR